MPLLEGVRIVDLTRAYAGPIGMRMLADMGAEVIKVEAVQMIDMPSRRLAYAENDFAQEPWNRSGVFHWLNTNKLGIAVNLGSPQGVDLIRDMVKVSDVVAENHSPRVMKNLGLDYPNLRKLNPSIILASMSGFGQTGPQKDFVAYASVMEAAGGITSVTGYAGGTPRTSGTAYGDWVLGAYGAAAILMALFRRRLTGKGTLIDVAGREAILAHLGEAVLDYSMNGWTWRPQGNRHPFAAPHGCYRCQDERWVAVAVMDDAEWERFRRAIGGPAWANDDRFADGLARKKHEDELDRLVETWTRQRTANDAFEALQQAGIAAGPVLDARDVMLDPHFMSRGFFQQVDHPSVGRRLHNRFVPAKFSLPSLPLHLNPAPRVGEHNRRVLADLLGLPEAALTALEQDRTIGQTPDKLPRSATEQPLNQPLWEREGLIRVDKEYNARLGQAYKEELGPKQ